MKSIYQLGLAAVLAFGAVSCQDKDYEIASPVLSPIAAESLTGNLVGNDYVWTWGATNGLAVQVSVYNGNTLAMAETVDGTTFTHSNVDTNVEYTYIFKLTDGTNMSKGVMKNYLRPGASKMSGLVMAQVDKTGGYDGVLSWDANETATSIELNATNGGSRTINETLAGNATGYTIENVIYGEEWTVTLTAVNADGKSLPVSTGLKIGKTAVGFLSEYPTPEDLIQNGDDDEASAWLWLNEEYPTAKYVYFGDITSQADLEHYRVLFWMRDIEAEEGQDVDVFEFSPVVKAATPIVRQWYADGGSLLLWSHATVYIGELGRLEMDMLKNNDKAIGTGKGGMNPDVWSMAISLNPASAFTKDHSSHPIYRGLTINSNDRCKLVPFKGAGWTEDHNCLFFNIPSALTGKGNQTEECYNELTQKFGIYPLGTWDSQIDFVSQLNVWEAQQGDSEFKGTVLCIGNGGCEFSMKNPDGTPDVSAHPKNNAYQDNVLKLAKNALEYLKTR